jgi:hypothetical protein
MNGPKIGLSVKKYGRVKTMSSAFRAIKKPMVIDAWEIDGTENYPEWVNGGVCYERRRDGDNKLFDVEPNVLYFKVKTLEGIMEAKVGDFLLRGVKGELYPCRRDIFLESYEVKSAEDN